MVLPKAGHLAGDELYNVYPEGMDGTFQAAVGFLESDFFQTAIKMVWRCIFSLIFHLSGLKLLTLSCPCKFSFHLNVSATKCLFLCSNQHLIIGQSVLFLSLNHSQILTLCRDVEKKRDF